MTVKELKKFIKDMDDDCNVVVDYGSGYIDPCSLEVYKQKIPQIGCKRTDSVVINIEHRAVYNMACSDYMNWERSACKMKN